MEFNPRFVYNVIEVFRSVDGFLGKELRRELPLDSNNVFSTSSIDYVNDDKV